MRKTIFAALVLTVFPILIQSEDEAFERGNRLFDSGNYRGAIEEYSKSISLDPQFVEAYFNKALAFEQVDKALAAEAWEEFITRAENNAGFESRVFLVERHLKSLSSPPLLPPQLSMNRYSEQDGDYYFQVIEESFGKQWDHFPVKLFVPVAEEKKARKAVEEAIKEWNQYFPLTSVDSPEEADISIRWVGEDSPKFPAIAGLAVQYLEFRDPEDITSSKLVVEVAILIYKNEKRKTEEITATIIHELGHALGIHGHSDHEDDIMYPTRREHEALVSTREGMKRVGPSTATKLSQRDVNTLIKIYNTDTLLMRY